MLAIKVFAFIAVTTACRLEKHLYQNMPKRSPETCCMCHNVFQGVVVASFQPSLAKQLGPFP